MILVLVGPTGSGKSKLAISLAKKLDAVIINADAFQVYKELNIATAKPSEEERMIVPHYLFDFLPLTASYNIHEYQLDLRGELAELEERKKNVIIAGGTGLYIRAGLFNYVLNDEKEVDVSEYENLSNEDLFNKLKELDPSAADYIHPNNRVRVLRAIKRYLSSGVCYADLIKENDNKPIYDVKFFGIKKEREDIYKICNDRVDEMVKNGLVEESISLIKKYGRDIAAFKAIGVKEFFNYIDGNSSLEETIELIKKNTRNYVKRQMTFFNHQFDVNWIEEENEILSTLSLDKK